VDNGMYYRQLKKYFDIFPRKNIGIFLVDDLKKDPVSFMQQIYKFLGANEHFIPPSAATRENSSRRTKYKLSKKIMKVGINSSSLLFRKIYLYFIVDFARKLGIEDLILNFNKKVNIVPFVKPKINPEIERQLKGIFKEDIENLEKFLNRDLSGWK
jgi:hypothetical protein